ncbi:PAS domain S-box protein [Pelagibius litoralis]|uniref:histidine kinase n=1 Tax=Pelagibius litoralis TaxID=374515 RepID=A0A967EX57_9PROT|nr:PAS domain S-box protein [Pelagibius litoralis]NIA67820.1 PAS domain S-box protein [Pelagibius litoralis]
MPTKAELTEELARLRQRVEEVESLEAERAKAEDALRESEERLRDFAAAASDWFWEMDAELRVCYLSERLREVTGVDPDEVIGKSRLELGAGDTDSEKWEAHLADLNARRPFRDFRYVYIAADGGRQYWSISGVPLFEEDGLFLGYRGTGRNLTDEYHARRMAFEAQDLLLQAVESFTAAVALFDADDRLLLFNQSYLDFHRYSSETIGPGMPFEELLRTQIKHGLIPAAFGREEDWLAERMERHRNPGEEFEVERSDGSWLRVREERTANGGIFFTATDVTETKAIERAEREIRDRLRAVIDHLPAGLTMKDQDGCYMLVNQQFQDLYGLQERKLLGDTDFKHFRQSEAEVFNAQDRNVLKTGVPMDVEMEVTRADGDMMFAMITRFPVLDSVGEAIGVGGIHVDITELKEKEQQLRIARDEAERANRAKSAFLANMSHELRTPLNAIIGFSEIMEQGLFGPLGNPHYSEYAEDIRRSASHLLSLISDILDLSKIEAGRMELHEESIDVAAVVQSCLTIVKESASNGSLELEADLPDSLPQLHADKRSIRQILLNLLSNAIKFTPAGGLVRAEAFVEPSGEFALVVHDNGIGMAEEDIEIVLQPFGQVEGAHTRSHDGTGLGLPITKSLAEMHGGKMIVQSKVGEGTAITLRFPAERVVKRTSGDDVPSRRSA